MADTLCITLCVFSKKKKKCILDLGKLRERRTCWLSGLSRDRLEEPRCGRELPLCRRQQGCCRKEEAAAWQLGCGILTSDHSLGRPRACTLTVVLAYFFNRAATLLRRLIRLE